jgi:uridine kinase
VPACDREGLLEAAYCVTHHPLVTFWRRLVRDLREHRKPPLVLVRRGWSLMWAQREVVRHAVALGCRPVRPHEAYAEIREREPAGRG